MATAMDREVGRLVAHLKATGDYDNTIFVFLSDNGAEPTDPYNRLRNRLFLGMEYDTSTTNIGRRGSFSAIGPGWASAASSPLSGYKFSATEGGLRAPLIIAWPGHSQVRAGAINGGLAHVTDILPTLLDLAGVAGQDGTWNGRPVERLAGRSLVPMLAGGVGSVHGDTPIGYELSGNAALFRGDYKLVRNLPPTGDGQWRLYDIKSDPGETKDLATAMPDRFAEMRADYAAFAKDNGVLEMPAGYTADEQINLYAWRQQGKKRAIQAGLVLGGVLMGLAALIWAWRHRRRSGI
jgi:arylsulfatase/uncharacterized sulfatase